VTRTEKVTATDKEGMILVVAQSEAKVEIVVVQAVVDVKEAARYEILTMEIKEEQ
jgi:hypothetical protein